MASILSSVQKIFICRVLAFDFDRDIAPVLRFLVDIGVGARHLADVATNAPMLFQHPVQVRPRCCGYYVQS